MSARCEQLRERALQEGLGGKSARAWSVHSRYCQNCRTEMFILETLDRQALGERLHLRRKEVAELLQTVQQRRRIGRPHARAWTWTLRLACVALAGLVIAETQRGTLPSTAGMASSPTVLASADPMPPPTPLTSEDGVTQPESDALSWPAGLGTFGRGKLRDLRGRISSRRDVLLQLNGRDLGERSRHDARSVTLSPASTPA